MLTEKILGTALEAVPREVDGIPVYASGHHRQTWDAHIVIGVRDVSPPFCFGYDWETHVIAYREWHPGRHGGPCPCCDPDTSGGSYYWGEVNRTILPVFHRPEPVDTGKLVEAVHEAARALRELPPNPLRWQAYGPQHVYGNWPTREAAAEWLAGHMERLGHDPNLGAERRQAALANADLLREGAQEVRIGDKRYGVRSR